MRDSPFLAVVSSKLGLTVVDCLNKVVSTLSVLEPFRRAAVGVPFLYQKVGVCPLKMFIAGGICCVDNTSRYLRPAP